jgi:hypothetical protein
LNAVFPAQVTRQFVIESVISFSAEGGLAAIAALGDVVGDARCNNNARDVP